MRSLLFGVSPFDPLVLSEAAVGVLLLAVAASGLPAFRAASIDPMRALRGNSVSRRVVSPRDHALARPQLKRESACNSERTYSPLSVILA
jgi:hypothetical protein